MLMLGQLRAGERVNHPVILSLQKIGVAANGSPYARGTVRDQSGTVNFICFDARVANILKEMANPCRVKIQGVVQPDKYGPVGAVQIIVENIEDVSDTENIDHLYPVSPKSPATYEALLRGLIEQLSRPYLRALAEEVFSGPFYARFIQVPAAVKYHHAYLGGLLEHTVDVAKMAAAMAKQADGADVEMVILGALLHDIGKVEEIDVRVGFEPSSRGRLIGHLAAGAAIVEKTLSRIEGFPPDAADELLHIILSHHGEIEKGSPIPCLTKESFIVHYADELDAALQQFRDSEGIDSAGWRYSRMLNRMVRAIAKPEATNPSAANIIDR